MSGDVQPRKRNKDKKRRRDEEETRPTGVHSTKMGPDDIQLHVHSDHGTGGHWCAKIFFFSLLAILLGLIGLILLENRGLADLDTPLSESRFADMLEGWVDEERESHDEHDVHVPEDHDDLDEHDQEHDDRTDVDHSPDDNEPVADSQENDDDGEDEVGTDKTKDDADDENEKDEGFEESAEADDPEDDNDERLNSFSKRQRLTIDNNMSDESCFECRDTNKNAQNLNMKEHSDALEEAVESLPSTQVTAKQLERQVDDLIVNYNKLAKTLNQPLIDDTKPRPTRSTPQRKDENDDNDDQPASEEQAEEVQDEEEDAKNDENYDDDDEGIAEDDNDDGSDENNDAEQLVAVDDDGNEIEPEQPAQEEAEEESSPLAVRIIVGLALVIVAHQVLLKRPQTNEPAQEPASDTELFDATEEFVDMKRRFTLVTAEEPIPSGDEDTEQPSIIETIADENDKSDEPQSGVEPIKPIEPIEAVETPSDEDIALKDIEENVVDLDLEELLSGEELLSEEESLSEENDYDSESSVDDSDLLKRLDEKYGKLPETTYDPDDQDLDDEDIDPTWTKIDRSGPAAVPTEDQLLDEEIRKANEQLAEDPQFALTLFEQIRKTHPSSAAAQYGVTRSLDLLADLKRSNEMLKRAINEYMKYIEMGQQLNDTEFKTAAERCIERMRFIGEHIRAVPVHEKLIERFDDEPHYRNQLAVTYLLVNRMADAKYVLHTTLLRWRDDGVAAAHYGFVLKNLDNDLEQAVLFLRQGIESNESGATNGRFYFNLGDALIRLGRNDEAKQVFKEAADRKLFPSEYQRSLYNVDHLKAKPFWTLAETGYKTEFRTLEQNWQRIRDEGLRLLSGDGYFTDEAENLRDTGIWKQFELFARGKKNDDNCKRTPFTCKLIEMFPSARFCKRGQVKFSVMHPNTHVWPHCGPTNCRLRAHLGLKTASKTSIRVATETRTWTEGQIMVFDDSFEHEVWHNGTTYRLILIVDVWHPDLTADEKKKLVPI